MPIPEDLLALLPPGAVMAFLLASASVYLILQVAKEDAKYSLGLKRFLLSIAWPIFILSTLVFIGLFVLALIPVAIQYSIVIPSISIDPSIFVFYALLFVFTIIVSLGSSYVIRKLQKYLPKSGEEKRIDELAKTVIENLKQEKEVFDLGQDAVKRSSESISRSVESITRGMDILKDNREILEDNREISKKNS